MIISWIEALNKENNNNNNKPLSNIEFQGLSGYLKNSRK